MDLRAGSLLKKVRWAGVAFAVVAAGSATADSTPRGGVYTNVCVDPETLDQGGDEVQLALRPTPHGTFAWCAGGCVRMGLDELRLVGDRISFSATERFTTQDGSPAGSTTHHYSGQFKASRLILVSSDDPDFGRVVMRRKPWKPDHLSLSESTADQTQWPAPIRRCG